MMPAMVLTEARMIGGLISGAASATFPFGFKPLASPELHLSAV
jgi:hypothetical protein